VAKLYQKVANNYLIVLGQQKSPAGYAGLYDCLTYLKVIFDYLRRANTD
jgi:hypothetical protein